MTTENTTFATISTDDLLTVLGAAAKQRTAWRKEMEEAQAAGDIKTRRRIQKVYHPLCDTLHRLAGIYVESL
jgi:hypothetical protein